MTPRIAAAATTASKGIGGSEVKSVVDMIVLSVEPPPTLALLGSLRYHSTRIVGAKH
eukprot:COSAG02_NODE_595_length_19813_cov_12.215380_7_plen_57_part_00